MSDEKRKTLTLKRKPPETTERGADSSNDTKTLSRLQVPRVVGRKKVVMVTTPPAWKVKKQALAEKVPHKIETQPAPRPKETKAVPAQAPAPLAHPGKKHKGVSLMPLDEAVREMKVHWPGLFDGERPRLMEIGIREKLIADMQLNGYAISQKRIKRCLKTLATSAVYLQQMVEGAPRYALDGQVMSAVGESAQQYAAERINRQHKL